MGASMMPFSFLKHSMCPFLSLWGFGGKAPEIKKECGFQPHIILK
jgi:hypothetical protein